MWMETLRFQKFKTAVVLVGSVLFLASFLVACGPGGDRALERLSPLGLRNVPITWANAPKLVWTQDGEHILFSSSTLLGVYVVDSAGLSVRSYPENVPRHGTHYHPGAFAPALSPDGSRIAYSVWVNQNSSVIETAAFTGSDVRLLTDVERDENGRFPRPQNWQNVYPAWSPDGRQLAFVSNRAVAGEYYAHRFFVMDADGTNVNALAPSVKAPYGSGIQWLRWSPDGSWLAFVGFELDEEQRKVYGLYTVQADGSGPTLIANTTLADMSPDGRRLAFMAEQADVDGNTYLALQTARPDGTDLVTVGKLEGTAAYNLRPSDGKLRRIYQPVWSPDGAWLAFNALYPTRPGVRSYGIFVTRPDGADSQELIMIHRDPGIDRIAEISGPGIMWTPDGEEVWTRDLALAVRSDGSGLREVIPGGIRNVVRTAWSPDGSQLAVLTKNEAGQFKLLAVDRDGAEQRELVRGDSSGLATIPEWQDTSRDYAACSAGIVVPEPEENPGLVQDCQTLITARNALAGEAYLNWGRYNQMGQLTLSGDWHVPLPANLLGVWTGVMIGGEPPRVQHLNLSSGDPDVALVTGVIPPELGDLTGLEVLDLGWNSLTGDIPPELGNLSGLKELFLTDNNLSGCIPKTLSDSVTVLRTDDLAYCE